MLSLCTLNPQSPGSCLALCSVSLCLLKYQVGSSMKRLSTLKRNAAFIWFCSKLKYYRRHAMVWGSLQIQTRSQRCCLPSVFCPSILASDDVARRTLRIQMSPGQHHGVFLFCLPKLRHQLAFLFHIFEFKIRHQKP